MRRSAIDDALSPPWEPLQAALLAYHRGDRLATFRVASTLWEDEDTLASSYYRPLEVALPRLERTALELCRGPVLDVGAGAGRLSLELQALGLAVTALDAAPAAVTIMRERGVRDARCEDVFAHRGGPYATLLLVMHGIGLVGSHAGLDRFLRHARTLLAADGQILCDSADLDATASDDDLAAAGLLEPGQVFFQIAFAGRLGEYYPWLFVGERALTAAAAAAGFAATVVARADRGRFLARLTPAPGGG
jgi:SAM-dependent methyltransferase